jgi:hypothetical protein
MQQAVPHTLIDRIRGAATLNVEIYEEVEHDTTATGQAAIVVAIVAICSAIGNATAGPLIVFALIATFLSWFLWAALTWIIGTKLFGGTATWGELLRTLGFAQSPGVLSLLHIVPGLGLIITPVVWIWQLLTGVVAIRQALDFTTGKAVATAIIAGAIIFVTMVLPLMLIAAGIFGLALSGAEN